MGDPEVEVKKIQLQTDEFRSLQVTECIEMYGEKACSKLPNPLECDSMAVSVMGDGRTCGTCNVDGQVKVRACGNVGDGIPISCIASPDGACHKCSDIYGNLVVDSCNRNSALYRARDGSGWQGAEAGWLVESDDADSAGDDSGDSAGDDSGDTANQDDLSDDAQCSIKARNQFAENLNKVMEREGLNLTYTPDFDKEYNLKHGYVTGCSGLWLQLKPYLTECWNEDGGEKCHCKQEGNGNQQTCRCARVNIEALRTACNQVPEGCNPDTWEASLLMEYGVATNWLFQGTYDGKKYGGYEGLPSSPSQIPSAGDSVGNSLVPGDGTTPSGGGTAPNCLGSPLVLDLDNNGIQTTSLEKGVNFNLMGHGKMNSAWVRGGDAFLVLDRNGNGIIDDGSELFGSATDIGGAPAQDGFVALAHLDHPSQGGNNDGRIDSKDQTFEALRLWTDKNHDGVSQPSEMQDLPSAGIQSINTIKKSSNTVIDALGNDLSLRGSFTRTDGKPGLMVDVLFQAAMGR